VELKRSQQKAINTREPSDGAADSEIRPRNSTGVSADSASTLSKRASVPAQGQRKQLTVEEGSKLPESLRKKLGQTDGTAKEPTKDASDKSSAGSSRVKDDATDSTKGSTKDDTKPTTQDAKLLDNVPYIPEQQADRPRAQTEYDPSGRPLSHKEWVQQKLARDKFPKGFVTIQSPSYILR